MLKFEIKALELWNDKNVEKELSLSLQVMHHTPLQNCQAQKN